MLTGRFIFPSSTPTPCLIGYTAQPAVLVSYERGRLCESELAWLP